MIKNTFCKVGEANSIVSLGISSSLIDLPVSKQYIKTGKASLVFDVAKNWNNYIL